MTDEQKQEILLIVQEVVNKLSVDQLNEMSNRQLRYLVGTKFNTLSSSDTEWYQIEEKFISFLNTLKTA